MDQFPESRLKHMQQLFTTEQLSCLIEISLQLGQRTECIFAQAGGSTIRKTILEVPYIANEIDIFVQFFQQGGTHLTGKRRWISS